MRVCECVCENMCLCLCLRQCESVSVNVAVFKCLSSMSLFANKNCSAFMKTLTHSSWKHFQGFRNVSAGMHTAMAEADLPPCGQFLNTHE